MTPADRAALDRANRVLFASWLLGEEVVPTHSHDSAEITRLSWNFSCESCGWVHAKGSPCHTAIQRRYEQGDREPLLAVQRAKVAAYFDAYGDGGPVGTGSELVGALGKPNTVGSRRNDSPQAGSNPAHRLQHTVPPVAGGVLGAPPRDGVGQWCRLCDEPHETLEEMYDAHDPEGV